MQKIAGCHKSNLISEAIQATCFLKPCFSAARRAVQFGFELHFIPLPCQLGLQHRGLACL